MRTKEQYIELLANETNPLRRGIIDQCAVINRFYMDENTDEEAYDDFEAVLADLMALLFEYYHPGQKATNDWDAHTENNFYNALLDRATLSPFITKRNQEWRDRKDTPEQEIKELSDYDLDKNKQL